MIIYYLPERSDLMSISNKKFENYLENILSKHDLSTLEDNTFLKNIIDDMYLYERQNASKKCENKSMGFSYIIEEYKHYKKCLDLFTTRMIEEILKEKENTENLIHNKYKTMEAFQYEDYISNNKFFYNLLSKYDKDLANYTRDNWQYIEFLKEYKEYVLTNWNFFEKEKKEFNKLVSDLDLTFDELASKGRIKRWSRHEIYIYLFKNNDMIDQFEKYYDMEDTTFEEKKELIKTSDVFTKIVNIDEIKIISEMDKMVKRNINNKGLKKTKRLIH